MSYTDEQMRAFSQIAYTDFTKAYEFLQATQGGDSFSIEELEITAKVLDPSIKFDQLYCVTEQQKRDWKIVAVHDTNPQNGFYGCIIETAPGKATLAFRGSEEPKKFSNLIHDWFAADLGLFNSFQTRQHAEVDRFLKKYSDKINQYDSISLTGHSLGGNLAEYATLVSHKYGFDSRVDRCVSLDGPGFSNEFIALHTLDVLRMKDKMKHYSWSLVGSLLFNLPGVEYKYCEISNEANTKDGKEYGAVSRHDTKYLVFDENGNLNTDGVKQDIIAKGFSSFSKRLELTSFGYWINPILTIASVVYGNWDAIGKIFNDLANSTKTTYQNIIKSIKELFRTDRDYFRVDTNSFRSDVEEIREYINTVRNNVNDMFTSVQQLNGMWTGPANKAFTEKFINEKQMIEDYLKEIDGYVNRLESERISYNNCEQRALEMISAIRV